MDKKAQEARRRITFNLAPGEVEKIDAHQGHACAITGKSFDDTPFYIDHAHEDGLVRGLLSFKVNKGLDLFDDDPKLLRAAADYLDNPPAVTALGEKVFGVLGRVTKKAKNRRYGPDGSKTPQPRAAFQTKKAIRKEESTVVSSVSGAA